MKKGHSWNRVFWLGFPVILGLSWIHQNVRHILSALVLCGATLAWILYDVKSISRSVLAGGLLTTYARIPASMGFAALVMVGLFAVETLGAVGYVFALAFWLGLHLLVRALVG